MATQKASERFQLGDIVRILHSGFGPSTIVELRGALGPKGAYVYRVQVGKKDYTEVLEEQLELITPAHNGS